MIGLEKRDPVEKVLLVYEPARRSIIAFGRQCTFLREDA